MVNQCFAIFDSKVNAFLSPFFCRTDGQAVRFFQALVQDSSHDFGKFPEDYALFELGSFEDMEGKFTLLPTPRPIVRGPLLVKLEA